MAMIAVSWELRDATAADQPLLAALYRAAHDDLALPGNDPAIAALFAMQQRIHAEGVRQRYPGARHLLLHSEGRGVAQLQIARLPDCLYLIDIAVLPGDRRQGWGGLLLRWAQQQAAEAGLPLRLQVRRHNHTARRLYLSAGLVAGSVDEVFEQMHWHPA